MARTKKTTEKTNGKHEPKATAKPKEKRGSAPSSSTPPVPVSQIPPAPWSDLALPAVSDARDDARISPERVTVEADPNILPDSPKESRGLFELLSSVARRALELGLAAREPSFHVFVAAEPEVMIEDDVARHAERLAKRRPPPPDLLYVHDFDHPAAPVPLALPPGMGPRLVEAMDELISVLREEIPLVAGEDSVQKAQEALAKELEQRNKNVLGELEGTAKKLGFGIRTVQGGLQTFPILHGKPLSAEQFSALDESTKRALSDAETKLARELEKAGRLVQKEGQKLEDARNEAFSRAAEALIHERVGQLKTAFSELANEGLNAYFDRVESALIEDWQDLVQSDEDGEGEGPGAGEEPDHDPEHAKRLGRFRANLLVENSPDAPAPVIYDTNPTYPNLFGYLERRAKFGALLTDFTRIRAGSLQRASGGYLIVRAADLMADPIIWERIKRVLRERRIAAEDPLGPLGLYATSLRPVATPINVRVILVGSPDLYAALLSADPDFASLFRIKVEVESSVPRTPERLVLLDAYMMGMAKEREWGRFSKPARARLLDLATRLAGEQDKLSIALSPLEETAAFASAVAAARETHDADDLDMPASTSDANLVPFRASIPPPEKSVVTEQDIEIAWRERRERAGAAERSIRELTIRGEVHLDTSGERVGVVNGLSVYSAGDVEFGQPMRITAVVALGREGLIDVEREASLGGSIHTKGLAIVRGYLGLLFGQERPLSLRAQIVFEQSYGEIDGDSASSSELYAIMSALSEVPILQGFAVTGSVNQLGEVQAIGGVCAKIEGFYELCVARGLTGKQGVLIPRSNIRHLVLRSDVARAIQEGKFHLYSVSTVQEGIELLTGVPAGARDANGRFPAGSVFGRVERRLIEIAERLRRAEGAPIGGTHELGDDQSGADLGDASDF